MNVELVDVDDLTGAPHTLPMDETPLPGDEIQFGLASGSPVVRTVRKRYVLDDAGRLHSVQVYFRNTGAVTA